LIDKGELVSFVIHPAFPQPDDASAVIWRYMDFTKFKWLVDCRRLLMPRADQLGDPYEGTVPHGDLEYWRQIAAETTSEEHRNTIQHNRKILSALAERFRPHYYVSCWNMDEHENIEMWNRFTSEPESVAIKSTYAALRDCLPGYVGMGKIRYIDYAKDRMPTMNQYEYIMHKRKDEHHVEQEIRAVTFPPSPIPYAEEHKHFADNHWESEDRPGFLVYAPKIDLARLVQGVVLNPRYTSEFEKRIIGICASSGLPRPEPSSL
jgi:hypothetical protein